MRETAGMCLHQFSAQELRKKRSRKICQKTTMDRVFETTFLVIFLPVTQIKNCCMVCGRRLFSKAKDCTNNLKSCLVIVWAFWMQMLVVKDARGLSKNTNKLDQWYTLIMSLLSQVIIDHLKYSLSCEHFLELQLCCYCNVLQFQQKVKV